MAKPGDDDITSTQRLTSDGGEPTDATGSFSAPTTIRPYEPGPPSRAAMIAAAARRATLEAEKRAAGEHAAPARKPLGSSPRHSAGPQQPRSPAGPSVPTRAATPAPLRVPLAPIVAQPDLADETLHDLPIFGEEEPSRTAISTSAIFPGPAAVPGPRALAASAPRAADASSKPRVFLCPPTVVAPLPASATGASAPATSARAGGAAMMDHTITATAIQLAPPPQAAAAPLARGSYADKSQPRLGGVGQYKILAPLAHGAMGAVYRAEHGSLRRSVALKVLHPHLRTDPEAQARFMAEAVATSRVVHPNVLTVHDFGEGEAGAAFMVTELLTGETLASRLGRERELPITDALNIARQIAAALGAVHKAGIVHRDLKPENVFLSRATSTGPDQVKLLDFGVCKVDLGESPNLTQQGSLVGTPYYMAPEQARDAKLVDPRSDVYALGCILYEMLCGQLPFAGDVLDVLMAHRSSAPTAPRHVNPSVPPALDALVLAMMAKSPADRPASMADVEDRLATTDPGQRFAAAPIEADHVVPRRRARWPLALAAVVALLAAGAAVAFSTGLIALP